MPYITIFRIFFLNYISFFLYVKQKDQRKFKKKFLLLRTRMRHICCPKSYHHWRYWLLVPIHNCPICVQQICGHGAEMHCPNMCGFHCFDFQQIVFNDRSPDFGQFVAKF